jgi:hypothetical protein
VGGCGQPQTTTSAKVCSVLCRCLLGYSHRPSLCQPPLARRLAACPDESPAAANGSAGSWLIGGCKGCIACLCTALRRWRYDTFVNWEMWWPGFPILVYFKVYAQGSLV